MTDTTKPKGMTDDERLAVELDHAIFEAWGSGQGVTNYGRHVSLPGDRIDWQVATPKDRRCALETLAKARALLAPGIAAEARRQLMGQVRDILQKHAVDMNVRILSPDATDTRGLLGRIIGDIDELDATPPQPAVAPQWEPKGVRAAIERAVELFGGKEDGVFNLANLSHTLAEQCNFLDKAIDGRLCRLILTGRNDVEKLSPGDAHWRMLPAIAPGVPGEQDESRWCKYIEGYCKRLFTAPPALAARPAPVQAEPVYGGVRHCDKCKRVHHVDVACLSEPSPSAAPEAPSVPAVEAEKWLRAGGFAPPKMAEAIVTLLDTLRARAETAERALLAEQVRAGELEAAGKDLTSNLDAHRAKVTELLATIDAQTRRRGEWESRLQHEQTANAQLRAQVAKLEEERDGARNELAEAWKALAASRATAEELRAELAAGKLIVAELYEWTTVYGEALSPGRHGCADTFGEGMRVAKAQVRGLLSSGQASAGTPLVESAVVIKENARVVAISTGREINYVAYVYCKNHPQAQAIAALLSGARMQDEKAGVAK